MVYHLPSKKKTVFLYALKGQAGTHHNIWQFLPFPDPKGIKLTFLRMDFSIFISAYSQLVY